MKRGEIDGSTNLGGIDDTGSHQVLVFSGRGVITKFKVVAGENLSRWIAVKMNVN